MTRVSMYPGGGGNINRVEKLMINLDTELPMGCAYTPCDRPARSPYQARQCEHMPVRCSLVDNPPPGYYFGRHYWYVYCSESCRDLGMNETGRRAWDAADRHQGQIGGMHSPGMRGTLR